MDDLTRTLREEAVQCHLPPCDVTAEAELLSSVLCGRLRCPELTPKDLYEPFHVDLLAAIKSCQSIDLPTLAESMQRAGTPTFPGISLRLIALRDETVFRTSVDEQKLLRRVLEMSRRRQLMRLMVRLRYELQSETTAAQAATRLRALTDSWERGHSVKPTRRANG